MMPQSTINLCFCFALLAIVTVSARLNCGSGGHVLANTADGLGFQVHERDIHKLCYETVCQRPADDRDQESGTEPNSGKISRRYSLPELREGPTCPELTNYFMKGKTIFKLEIQWNNKVFMNATFMERTLDITQLVVDKFKGDIGQIVNYFFAKSTDVVDNAMVEGAFLEDIPLEAIKMDIFLSRQQKALKVIPRILYKLCEPSMGNLTREKLINACKEKIEKWNREAGCKRYEYNEENCLRSSDENRQRSGVDETVIVFPAGQNQSGGGRSYSGPIVPLPLKPDDEIVYNTEFTVYPDLACFNLSKT